MILASLLTYINVGNENEPCLQEQQDSVISTPHNIFQCNYHEWIQPFLEQSYHEPESLPRGFFFLEHPSSLGKDA